MTDENRERLKIALLLIIGALGDIVFMPIGLVINIGLIVWLLFKIDLIFAAEPTAGTDTNTAAAVASNTNFFICLL